MNKDEILKAMKAEHIPAESENYWYIRKANVTRASHMFRQGKHVVLPVGVYTFLYRLTDETIHRDPPGEVVMEDSPFELNTHLGFVLQARGNVLVTGLGLGCVIRGLLCSPEVDHITCIENSPDVLKLVGPYMPTDRLTIVEAEALEWTAKSNEIFDCAWHDLWTDRAAGEPPLDMWHAQLIRNCDGKIRRQGAWAFAREAKRKLLKAKFPWIG